MGDRTQQSQSCLMPVPFSDYWELRQQFEDGLPIKEHFNRAEVISLFLSLRTSVLFFLSLYARVPRHPGKTIDIRA